MPWRKKAPWALAILLLLPGVLAAQSDNQRQRFHCQGRLTGADGHPVADSTWAMTLRLWDSETGGSVLWSESQRVRTTDGLYALQLGLDNPLTQSFHQKCWLGVQVGDGPEVVPRTLLDFSAYCYNADMVDGYHAVGSQTWSGNGYSELLCKMTYFQVQGEFGAGELFVPIVHFHPFRIVVTCPNAAPKVGDVAYVECVENDGAISCLGMDGSGAQIRTALSLASTDRVMSVRNGHVTVSCPGDGSRRLRIRTQGEWVLGYVHW